MRAGSGDQFQRDTKYERGKLPGGRLDPASRPAAFKSYPDAARFKLERPEVEGGMALWQTLRLRHSVRRFSRKPVTAGELSCLLWASQGLSRVGPGFAFRTAPSAGALYPLETYVSIQNVSGIGPGLYHYDVRGHTLEQLRAGSLNRELASAALDQDFLEEAAAVFIWTAVFGRAKWKYRQRAYRYVYLDAGHIAQNLALAAVALGLGSCQVAALYDDEVNALLRLDGQEESVLYMSALGRPGKERPGE
jgi:SagB-type dehydrogenase family enzyme